MSDAAGAEVPRLVTFIESAGQTGQQVEVALLSTDLRFYKVKGSGDDGGS